MQGFDDGFEYFLKISGSDLSAYSGNAYIDSVNETIDKLVDDLNNFDGYATGAAQLKGDVAEFWHAGTFNISAALKGSSHRAYVEREHGFSSPDITTNFGDRYGLKYYKNGVASAKAQAKSIFERYNEYRSQGGTDSLDKYLEDRGYSNIDSIRNDPIYSGQKRLIPKDQLVEAIKWLEKKIKKESDNRPEQVARYEETLALLVDRLEDNDGAESIPLSRKDAQKLAELAKKGKINADELGLTTEELVTYEYILQQAFKAGLTAATVSIILKITPEIIKTIKYLIKHGEIDEHQFKNIGFAALSVTAEGFLRGSISAGITIVCKAGLIGSAAKSLNPSAIGMTVVLVMDAMKNAFQVAIGKMTHQEMADILIKETFIASISSIGGVIGQAILLELPTLGFMLGSFLGSVFGGIVYSSGYNFLISFCVDTGFTMFGLVRQNYVLPDDVIQEIGIKTFDPTQFEYDVFTSEKFKREGFEPTRFSATTFKPFFLRRGVIGIREVGYT